MLEVGGWALSNASCIVIGDIPDCQIAVQEQIVADIAFGAPLPCPAYQAVTLAVFAFSNVIDCNIDHSVRALGFAGSCPVGHKKTVRS